MPIDFLPDFLAVILFVFALSALCYMLAGRSADSNTSAPFPELGAEEESPQPIGFDELAEEMGQDEELLSSVTPLQIPHMELPGAVGGGGAVDEPCSKISGDIKLKFAGDPQDKRKYNRRLRERRAVDAAVEDDRRTLERRIWLRREEDRKGKKLLNVSEAADTLGVPVEQIYKWLDKSDIPFYQVTDGRQKAIRFEINELLQWYSTLTTGKKQ